MKIFIKNMVCNRCITAVQDVLEKTGLNPNEVKLGEADLMEQPARRTLKLLNISLKMLGFELIDSRERRITEQIKNLLVIYIHHGLKLPGNLSEYISQKLHFDYEYLDNIFSETEGINIEQFLIRQKIETIKELLVYDEMPVGQIADKLGYGSGAYLSNYFKKQTGLPITFYKSLKARKQKNIDEL